MYLHHLPDYPALEKLFNDAGYTLEVDLSNSIIIEKGGDWVEYDGLTETLQNALDKFQEDNHLND